MQENARALKTHINRAKPPVQWVHEGAGDCTRNVPRMYPATSSQRTRNVPRDEDFSPSVSEIAALALPPGVDDKIFFDDELPGFGLRLRRSGDRSWWVQYAMAGRTRKLRLGSLAELDISKARSTAKDVLARVRLGGDPAHEKRAGRVLAGETVGALLPAFLERQRARLKPRSYWKSRGTSTCIASRCTLWPSPRWTVASSQRAWAKIAKTTSRATANRVAPACPPFARGALAKVMSTPTQRRTPTRHTRTAHEIACWPTRAGGHLAQARRRSLRHDPEAPDADRRTPRRDRIAAMVRG